MEIIETLEKEVEQAIMRASESLVGEKVNAVLIKQKKFEKGFGRETSN